MNAPEIANKAAELVGGDRAESHGDMHQHFARTKSGSINVDDWIDGAGYLACAGEVSTREYRR
jgi:hypothetical protein